jgi:hypothetical protein
MNPIEKAKEIVDYASLNLSPEIRLILQTKLADALNEAIEYGMEQGIENAHVMRESGE